MNRAVWRWALLGPVILPTAAGMLLSWPIFVLIGWLCGSRRPASDAWTLVREPAQAWFNVVRYGDFDSASPDNGGER